MRRWFRRHHADFAVLPVLLGLMLSSVARGDNGDQGRWSTVTPSSPVPPYRVEHAALYDPDLQSMMMFGGFEYVFMA